MLDRLEGSTGPLSPTEKVIRRLAQQINERPRLKALAQAFNEGPSRWLIELLSRSRIHLVGLEKLAALSSARGVLLAANHRSFFDLHLVATYFTRHGPSCRRAYFPVRSSFWYDRLPGAAVNALVTGMVMYPPIFREPHKRQITRQGLDFLARELRRPGTLVGMHPEGRRSRGPDPYELLPAEQSFGRVVLKALPQVVPVFVNGVGDDLAEEAWGSVTRRGSPIIIVYGDPVDVTAFRDLDGTRLKHQIQVGRGVLDQIRRLAETERSARAVLAPGRGHDPVTS